MAPVFLKFFLVHELETLGMLWREETREKGDREGRGRGERQSGGSYGGEQAHHFSCTHLGQETLFGKKYLWRISVFYYSYKSPLLPSGCLIPPSSGVDQITHLPCALHSPELSKGIIHKTIAWCLDQDYSYTFWRGNEEEEEFSSQDR